MERDRLRVGGLLVAFLALIVGALFAMNWFVLKVGGVGELGIGLRKVEACGPGMPCVSMSLSAVKGFYTTLATIAFWGTILFTLVVAFQAGTRLVTGVASPSISRLAYLPGVVLVVVAAAAGYVFGPEVRQGEIEMVRFAVERTFAPLMLIGGLIAGIALLHVSTVVTSDDAGVSKPVEPPVVAPEAPVAAVAASPARPSGELAYAVRSGALTTVGLDARREDGTPVLVLWRDLVAIVVRRLPAELDGATIIDLVSRPGSTLRLVTWSRLSGEATMPTGDAGVRTLVAKLRELAPEARLDGPTRNFIETSDAAAQFPDRAALETHDARVDQLGAAR